MIRLIVTVNRKEGEHEAREVVMLAAIPIANTLIIPTTRSLNCKVTVEGKKSMCPNRLINTTARGEATDPRLH